MNRRGFLSSILALSAAPAIVRAASLMPVRGIVIPSMTEAIDILYGFGTPAFIARESLQILMQNISFTHHVNREYMASGVLRDGGGIITIRRPHV